MQPAGSARPDSTEGLVDVVRSASARGLRVSAVGAGRAGQGVGGTDGVAIDLSGLTRVHSVDPAAGVATVGPGLTLAALAKRLAGFGLTLPSPGDVPGRHVGDAVAVGPLAVGPGLSGLATHVVGLELVTADGVVRHCSRTRDPDLWCAARWGLGAFGAPSAVSLRVVPGFVLRAVESVVGLAEVVAPGATDGEVSFTWDGRSDVVRVVRTAATDAAPRNNGGVRRALRPARPDVVDRPYRILGQPASGRSVVACSVALDDLPEAVERLRTALGHRAPPVAATASVVEVALVAADDAWLSPAGGRASAHIGVRCGGGAAGRRRSAAVVEALGDLGARPHWPGVGARRSADLAALYPHWDDWQAVRRAVDPAGTWSTPHLDRILGPVRAAG